MRRAARTDANQAEIVKALRQAHISVLVLSDVGKGVPDLLVAYQGESTLPEVKRPGHERDLTPDQVEFHATWRGRAKVVTSVGEALDVVLALDGAEAGRGVGGGGGVDGLDERP